MKRKRGSKKGHKKGKSNDPAELNNPASAPVSINAEDTIDDSQHDSDMDTEPPAVEADKPSNIKGAEADQPNDNSIGKAGPGRFKVKLKSSRVLEPYKSYSDIQTPSDTDKSNQQATVELNNKTMEKEDSTYSDGQTSEMENSNSEMVTKKAGSIKIKSSKALGLSIDDVHGKNIHRANSPPQMPGKRDLVLSDDEKTSGLLLPKKLQRVEIKQSYRDPRCNEKELSAALLVCWTCSSLVYHSSVLLTT